MSCKAKAELAHIIENHQHHLIEITNNSWKTRTLYAIARCRTAAMGGHIDRCTQQGCHKLHMSYNSCRNRHCPKCQGHLREQWIVAREQDLLNTSYFHVVFTLPDHLNELVLQHPKMIYQILFKTAWQVLVDFGQNPRFLGARTGMIAVLHTWGQNLSLHPHLHCIVPAGGVTKSGKWKSTKSKGKFLFPVKDMSKVFRARFVAALRKELMVDKTLTDKLFAKRWVIYCKQPFYGPKQVIEYLGRYSHKIAISNSRILSTQNDQVLYQAKDYRKAGKKVLLTLRQREFIRRFAMHILPKGFTRIRHYGILSSSSKKQYKVLIDQQIGGLTPMADKTPSAHRICPACKKGALQTVCTFDQRGPPKHWMDQMK
jgi:hypothetical protein